MYNSSYTPPKKRGILKTFITVIITVAVTVTVMRYVPEMKASTKQGDVSRLEANVEDLKSETRPTVQNNVTTLIENIMPSVVGVGILKPDGLSIFDKDTSNKWGLGTGIIVSDKGYILTNQHLANKKNTKVIVTLYDGSTVEGKVLWTEAGIDLAIVKIDANNIRGVVLR